MYAYEISKGIKERFKFSAAMITVYVVLYRMRREGLIRMVEERTTQGKPARKYYEATAEGKKTLLKGKKLLEDTILALS